MLLGGIRVPRKEMRVVFNERREKHGIVQRNIGPAAGGMGIGGNIWVGWCQVGSRHALISTLDSQT
jgi:hypothetical protein